MAAYAGRAGRVVAEIAAGLGIEERSVIHAVASIPRHLFVDEALWPRAYSDDALPIGQGQTISKISTVLTMTAALELKQTDRVLEVGTGSGYQAAVLAQLAREIYSVERIGGLSVRAQGVLHRLHAFNVKMRIGDGSLGWTEAAPFDKIIVTAAAATLPRPLLTQLTVGGRLVVPVEAGREQILRLVVRCEENRWEESDLEACRFVPLISGRATG
jgi:protein-L-isoaspartate(D-aspartate) O-methyltransferase